VNTHLLIEGVLAHASITFSAILTSISAIDFYISCISNLLLDITWCKVFVTTRFSKARKGSIFFFLYTIRVTHKRF
jgi:hypothetical protein